MSNSFWFALPLIVSVSLVYAATRHEEVGAILSHAFRVAVWIVGFMVLVFGVLYPIQRQVSWIVRRHENKYYAGRTLVRQ